MTATVVSLSGASPSAFSRRKPGASSRWPRGWPLNSRCPCPSPVTCLFASPYTQYSILDTLLSSVQPSLSGLPLVNVSTCQHVPSRKRVSPCPRASMSPLLCCLCFAACQPASITPRGLGRDCFAAVHHVSRTPRGLRPRLLRSLPAEPHAASGRACFAAVHHASRSPSVAYFFLGDGKIPAFGNVTILNSPPDAATHRLYRSWGSCTVE